MNCDKSCGELTLGNTAQAGEAEFDNGRIRGIEGQRQIALYFLIDGDEKRFVDKRFSCGLGIRNIELFDPALYSATVRHFRRSGIALVQN